MLITVVTPTLNCAQWMHQCIGSVLMQKGEGIEVEHIVADGGSTDSTAEIAESYGCTMFPRDPADSWAEAYNKAAMSGSGELTGFLGSDDVLLPGALLAVAQRYRSSGRRWVTGAFQWCDGDMRPLGTLAAPPEWAGVEAMAALGWCYINDRSTYFEASFFKELGGLDTRYSIAPDYDLFLRAMQIAPYAREPQVLALFRRHGSNLSVVRPEVTEEFEQIAAQFGPDQPWKRTAMRLGMKAFVNVRNPTWSFRKFRPPTDPA
jgi:glycosyltransferase involved in cell wall biosynthesis